jgi:hypothetical protein
LLGGLRACPRYFVPVYLAVGGLEGLSQMAPKGKQQKCVAMSVQKSSKKKPKSSKQKATELRRRAHMSS